MTIGISECAIRPGQFAAALPVDAACGARREPERARDHPGEDEQPGGADQRRSSRRMPRGRRRSCATAASPRSCRTPSIPAARPAPRPCPGRTGSDGRWSNGLPIAMRPSRLRRMRRQPRRHHAVHLERVGARAPAVTAAQRPCQRDGQIDQQPNLDRPKGSRVGAGELQPDECEQAQHRRPISPRIRIAPPNDRRPNSRCTVRTGEIARHTGPTASDNATRPTHNIT